VTLTPDRRLFVALALSDALRSHVAQLSASALAHTAATMVPAANLHVTLQFLGNVAPAAEQDLMASIADVLCGPAVRVRVGELVPRPSAGRARLVALELEDVDGALTVLAKRIHRATANALGGAVSNRPLWPHITVARFRRPERVRRSPATRSEHVFDIARVALYHSDIAPGRAPRYHELLGVTLGTHAQRSPSHG
jgi:2'-5' RNA ligase